MSIRDAIGTFSPGVGRVRYKEKTCFASPPKTMLIYIVNGHLSARRKCVLWEKGSTVARKLASSLRTLAQTCFKPRQSLRERNLLRSRPPSGSRPPPSGSSGSSSKPYGFGGHVRLHDPPNLGVLKKTTTRKKLWFCSLQNPMVLGVM